MYINFEASKGAGLTYSGFGNVLKKEADEKDFMPSVG